MSTVQRISAAFVIVKQVDIPWPFGKTFSEPHERSETHIAEEYIMVWTVLKVSNILILSQEGSIHCRLRRAWPERETENTV
jgi:hypothetical protein